MPAGALVQENGGLIALGTSTEVRAGAYVDEALSWLPGTQKTPKARKAGPRILLAKIRLTGITLRLDLQGAHPGMNRFMDLERFLRLDQQLRAKSALPVLEINLRTKS